FTTFGDNLERIRAGNTARVPVLAGNTQNDGTLFTVGENNLTAFLDSMGVGAIVSADVVRALYPEENDTDVIADSFRDFFFLCPASLWTEAFIQSGLHNVFRYEYGEYTYNQHRVYCAVFPDLQLFPNAGAWHSSERVYAPLCAVLPSSFHFFQVPELFGTFNASTATPNEVTLSKTYQTAIANFIKNPNDSPAPNWPKYAPGGSTQTLARLAYNGNVDMDNFVQAVTSDSQDAPCTSLWNAFLD
ncbi:hypothetical protein GYMLUDRAFT_175100, partial [Collybiopsis luxurians FD-317 M1]